MKFTRMVYALLIVLSLSACQAASEIASPASTVEALPTATEEMQPVRFSSLEEAEKAAGFDVRAPAYLPEGVSLDFATYQATPSPQVILQYKIVHPEYGEMGYFFQIVQEPRPQAPPDTTACGSGDGTCEVVEIAGTPVVYHLFSGGTEGLDWYQEGYVIRLLRTAGEPGKVYRDELLKVAVSLD